MPDLFLAASSPPAPSHLRAIGQGNPADGSPRSGAPGRAPSPAPPPPRRRRCRARGAEGINRRPGGTDRVAAGVRGEGCGLGLGTGRLGAGAVRATPGRCLSSPPLLSGPHPAATAKARWRVNAAGAEPPSLPPLPPFQRGCGRRGGAFSAGRRGSGEGEGKRLALCPARGFWPLPLPAGGGSRSFPALATGGPGEERDPGAEEEARVGSQTRCGRGRTAFATGPAGSETSPVACGDE